jgi:DNA-directed RNA polymerase specialized sigma24 family protein
MTAMSCEGSVTQWISELRIGDADQAQQELWNRYFTRLLGLARIKLRDAPRTAEDEEDVAICALQSFFGGVQAGKFPDVHDRMALWPLLAKITAHKALNQRKRQLRKKRGGRHVHSETSMASYEVRGDAILSELAEDDLTPEILVTLSDQCRHLFAALPNEDLRTVARMKLEGHTHAEIARATNVVERTVERRVNLIRTYWSRELDQS